MAIRPIRIEPHFCSLITFAVRGLARHYDDILIENDVTLTFFKQYFQPDIVQNNSKVKNNNWGIEKFLNRSQDPECSLFFKVNTYLLTFLFLTFSAYDHVRTSTKILPVKFAINLVISSTLGVFILFPFPPVHLSRSGYIPSSSFRRRWRRCIRTRRRRRRRQRAAPVSPSRRPTTARRRWRASRRDATWWPWRARDTGDTQDRRRSRRQPSCPTDRRRTEAPPGAGRPPPPRGSLGRARHSCVHYTGTPAYTT